MTTIPWTYAPRPDTRTSNVRMGMWLFLASEAMFFGSLFSAVVLLRTGAATWPSSSVLGANTALLHTALVIGASLVLPWRSTQVRSALPLLVSSTLGAAFLLSKTFEYSSKLQAGLHPSSNLLLACWFVITALHALHVAGGIAANLWVARGARRGDSQQLPARVYVLRLYWYFVDLVWLGILVTFYFV